MPALSVVLYAQGDALSGEVLFPLRADGVESLWDEGEAVRSHIGDVNDEDEIKSRGERDNRLKFSNRGKKGVLTSSGAGWMKGDR